MSIDSIVGSAREFTSSGNTTRIILPVARNRSSFVREQDICIHGRRLHDRRLCKGRCICILRRRRRQCALCGNPRERRCPHGRIKYDCIDCRGGVSASTSDGDVGAKSVVLQVKVMAKGSDARRMRLYGHGPFKVPRDSSRCRE